MLLVELICHLIIMHVKIVNGIYKVINRYTVFYKSFKSCFKINKFFYYINLYKTSRRKMTLFKH